ncbi:MAG: zinc-ribbon domain-containing protein [Polyangiaceae bacterium]|nr:zinc-ribbon domain-containing protein [Polyangiaceae bacterium]
MLKVACAGCKSPYQVDERRIPPAGLRMRCPKCGVSLLVTLEGTKLAGPATPPAKDATTAARGAPRPIPDADDRKRPTNPASPAARKLSLEKASFGDLDPKAIDLPALAAPAAGRAQNPPEKARTSFGELDAFTDLPGADRKVGFGELDFEADLPAVPAGGPRLDGAHSPKAAGAAKPPKPASPKKPPGPSEIDLPALADRTSDLPSPAAPRGFGVIDLPAPKEAETTPPKKEKEFGQLDSVAGLDIELLDAAVPSSARQAPRDRAPERPSQPELLLREPDENEPPRRRSRPSFSPEVSFDRVTAPPDMLDLPGVAAPGLPIPAGASELPKPSPAALPSPVEPPGLPVGAGDRKSGPPVERKAPPKPEDVQRMAKALQAEIEPPAPERNSIEFLLNESIAAAAPAPAEPTKPAAKEEPLLGGEFSPSLAGAALDLEPSGNVGPKEPVAANPTGTDKNTVGLLESASLDLTAGPAPKAGQRAGDRGAIPEEAPPKKRTLIRTALLASLIILGGSSLTLMPDVGAFGWKAISDKINASAHANALAGLKARAQADLDADTYVSSAAALQKARIAQQEAPRHRPTAAYTAYLAFQRSLRFSRRGADEAFGKQLLSFASTEPSDAFSLAVAAQDAMSGQLDRARQAAGSLAQRSPGDLDIAVLLGEIELAFLARAPSSPQPAAQAAGAPEASVAAWKRAVEIKKSARTLYGLARAEQSAGDLAAAKTSARAAISASPSHAGARILLASLLWQAGKAEEEEALSLLNQVVSDGPVKSAASEPELIEAEALLGHVHLGKSRISAAEQAFASALKRDPQSMKALLGSGELFYRSGRYTEATARFDAAMRADPRSVPAKVGAAKTWLALERMKEAKDLLKKALAERPSDPILLYWSARTDEALGNKKEAEAAYIEAIKLGEGKPEGVDAYVALSYLLGSQGRADEAAAKLAEATAKYPDLPALHRAKGEIALQSGRYEEAKTELMAALAGEDDLGTRFKLGVTLRRMRAFDEAAAVFDKVASIDKDFPGLSLEQGLMFEETGQSDKALAMYAAALEKAPNDLDLKLRVGSTQVIAGKAAQAEPILREVVRQRPSSAEANHFLGRALLMKGTADAEAMRFLERAIEIDPNRAEYHLYVGWAANESGQHARAADALKKALDLDRELADAYWQRGVLLQKQGAIVDALADLQTALAKRPSRFEAYATMAACFQDQGRWSEAEEAWRRAIAGNDKVPEWHYRLGRAYVIRGNRPGALAELERAVELAEASARGRPAWLFDAHFLLAETMRASGNRDKAIEHYKKYLETAPVDNAYRPDAERALAGMGAPLPR